MANESGEEDIDVFEKGLKALREGIERNLDRGSRAAAHLDRTLISLSAGALVFSMTFVGSLAPEKHLLVVLFSSWTCFAAAMIIVIFAMRSEQNALESAANAAGDALKLLESNPSRAREIIVRMGIPSPVVVKQMNKNEAVRALNNWALGTFVAGVLLLGVFVGYNFWHN